MARFVKSRPSLNLKHNVSMIEDSTKLIAPSWGVKAKLTGRIFGRLLVLGIAGSGKRGSTYWDCVCQCGRTTTVLGVSLANGKTKSCGCYGQEFPSRRVHGHATKRFTTREYRAWCSMKARCSNPKNPGYARYGGRGIKVCDRWENSFERFFEDLGPKPSIAHTLGRINNDKHYEPGNVKWSTPLEQANNRSSNTFIEIDGVKRTLADWERLSGVPQRVIGRRYAMGWRGARLLSAVRQLSNWH